MAPEAGSAVVYVRVVLPVLAAGGLAFAQPAQDPAPDLRAAYEAYQSGAYKGRILWRQAQAEQAEAALSQAIRQDPEHADSYLFRGVVRSRLRQPEDAEADLRRCFPINPQHGLAHYHLGKLGTFAYSGLGALSSAV